jgi:glycosyltransferase involved in cell wall biosynthesis
MENNSHIRTVLQIIPHESYSGVETSAKEIAINLSKNGYKVVALSGSEDLKSYFNDFGIKHYCLNIHSTNPFIILKNAIIISKIIKSENIDIVHARSRAPAWSCAIATRITKRFFITTFHAIYNNSSIFKRYYNSIIGRGKKIIAISDFVKRYIIKNYNVDIDRIKVIHRGIDTDYFNQDNISTEKKEQFKAKYHISDSITIVLQADFSKWKGHVIMLKALSMIKDLKFHCLFVGDLSKNAYYTEEVRKKIISLKLQSKVKIFGSESDKRTLYSISDIIVSASTEPEAFNKIMIEAQSMKKIVLATSIGSSCEIISDNITGFLTTANDPQALSDKLKYIIENINSPQIKAIQESSRNSVIQNFGLPKMIKETIELYEDILKREF